MSAICKELINFSQHFSSQWKKIRINLFCALSEKSVFLPLMTKKNHILFVSEKECPRLESEMFDLRHSLFLRLWLKMYNQK